MKERTIQEINGLIREAARRARDETSAEPEPTFTGEVSWPVDVQLKPGLEGAIACASDIGYVNGSKGWLVYRGYNCFDLAEHSSFDETSFLLLYGHLPSRSELNDFYHKLLHGRTLPAEVIKILENLPTATTHPMAGLRTGVSALGMLDSSAEETTVEAEREAAIRLIAALPTLAGAIARLRAGHEPLDPRPDLTHAGNFLYLLTGREPDPAVERIMDVALILHADHGMNASTFTSMVTNSSLSDMYSSVTAGIGSLKGPLHGGANERVLYQLEEIGSPDRVAAWFARKRDKKEKIMGFGHRVYKRYDPRARILRPLARMLSEGNPEIRPLFDTAVELEERVIAELGPERHIFPNVDFYSGLVYRALGIETAMFTPIFAVSRVAGWTARILEYLANNRLFRPRGVYTGPIQSRYVPMEER
jgi:citrate synthase